MGLKALQALILCFWMVEFYISKGKPVLAIGQFYRMVLWKDSGLTGTQAPTPNGHRVTFHAARATIEKERTKFHSKQAKQGPLLSLIVSAAQSLRSIPPALSRLKVLQTPN